VVRERAVGAIVSTWYRILDAIERLQAQAPAKAEKVQ